MPLTALVTIVLRIFSLTWLVHGCTLLATSLQSAGLYSSAGKGYWIFLPALLMFASAASVFFLSHPIARIATPPPNPDLQIGSLTVYDLYCFAFAFLGVYFSLSSIAPTINWLHYYVVLARDIHPPNSQREPSFYQLTQPLITLAAGTACLLLAPRLARKLTILHRDQSARPDGQADRDPSNAA